MKKFVIGLLVLCLAFAGIFGLTAAKNAVPAAVESPAAAEPKEGAVSVIGGADGPTEIRVDEPAQAQEPEATEDQEPETAAAQEPETETQEAEAAAAQEPETPAEPETAEPEAEEEADAAAAVAPGRLDYEALYSLYQPEEKVLRINGKEESWGDYFYLLFTQCGNIEDYFNSMAAYYGMKFGWSDTIEEDGEETFAQAALESAENLMVQLDALEAFAEENGVEISEELRGMVEAQKQAAIASTLGEEGTEEAFFAYLEKIHLTRDMYDRIMTQNFLYQEGFNKLYGGNAENYPDEKAVQFLEDNGYVTAAHIILMNTDEESGEKLDDAVLAERKAQLEALAEELRAIGDEQERKEAFLKKAAEISEDRGNAYYPEGYTFTAGSMVPAFEDAANALQDYEISDVVETSYGYHILMRFPLSADAIVEFNSSTGAARTARMLAANQEYGEMLQQKADSLTAEWLPGYEQPELLTFVAE